MRSPLKTPGVYPEEKVSPGAAPRSIPTAVPAFIGYTAKISKDGKNLINVPILVRSWAEFLTVFGPAPPLVRFSLHSQEPPSLSRTGQFESDGVHYALKKNSIHYRMYSSVKLFYQNEGADCWILSVGSYDPSKSEIGSIRPFTEALEQLEKNLKLNLLLIPDIVEMKPEDAYALQSQLVDHCGNLRDRMAILDIPDGYDESAENDGSVEKFRNGLQPTGTENLSYAAAYYPWIHTNIHDANEISCQNLGSPDGNYSELRNMITNEFTDRSGEINTEITGIAENLIAEMKKNSGNSKDAATFDGLLKTISASYTLLMSTIRKKINLLAPSGAMAAIYNQVDTHIGVWAAPVNVEVYGAQRTSVEIDQDYLEYLNAPLIGAAVCALREFSEGKVVVWGAHTLDGNSMDFRYINVRRTLIFLEQSIKAVMRSFIFEPNVKETWMSVKSEVDSFLTTIWKEGALQGARAKDAFQVQIGLGSTMTEKDIKNGILRIAVKVAVTHPSEFIVITTEQNQSVPG